MPVEFTQLTVGEQYDRPALARLWSYESFHALGRGVVTPQGQNIILLFITAQQQPALPQYDNRFDGELLWMDGEQAHRSDRRLVNSLGRDDVRLFYRGRDHSPFTYCGEVYLVEAFVHMGERPSRFVFTALPALLQEADAAIADALPSGDPDSLPGDREGRKLVRMHIVYERSAKNRANALHIHGHKCSVCNFDFDAFYGADLANTYIEIHHLRSITEIDGQSVDPATELAPLCSNCHRMAHRRRGEIVALDELRERVDRFQNPAPMRGGPHHMERGIPPR
jgi:5-methylcytosine-specific restriction protein A